MADRKITELIKLATPALNDEMYVVDVSEPSDNDKSKRVDLEDVVNLARGYGNHIFVSQSTPDNAVGNNGDVTIVRTSSIQINVFLKVAGVWDRQWAFAGGEAVLQAGSLATIPLRGPAREVDYPYIFRGMGISGYTPVTLADIDQANPPTNNIITSVAELRGGTSRTSNSRINNNTVSVPLLSYSYTVPVYLWFAVQAERDFYAVGLILQSVDRGGTDIPIVAQGDLFMGDRNYKIWRSVNTYMRASIQDDIDSFPFVLTLVKDSTIPNTFNRYAVVTQNDTPTGADFESANAFSSPSIRIHIPWQGWVNDRGHMHFALPVAQDAPTIIGLPGGLNVIPDFNVRSTTVPTIVHGDAMRTLSSKSEFFSLGASFRNQVLWILR